MAQKPSIPKGTRDFSPAEMAKRNYIFDTIKQVFALHDKLLFKILNSGDFLKNASDEQLLDRNCPRLTSALCEKGLRYDLTVPFARFVVQHRGELQFPFKRFQIQPVWRADRPQKGRYREFYQCDADVIGTDSLLNEIDLLQIIDDVFQRFGINITIKLNNRKVLSGLDFKKESARPLSTNCSHCLRFQVQTTRNLRVWNSCLPLQKSAKRVLRNCVS